MKYLIIVALIFVGAHSQTLKLNKECGQGTDSVNKIVGGVQAQNGDWGWQLAFKILQKVTCGASLINEYWFVTAAHCLVYGDWTDLYSVEIGYTDRENPNSYSTWRKFAKVVIHPKYRNRILSHDIALVKMREPVSFDNIGITPVCIPDGSEDYSDRTGYVTGFGTSFSGGSGYSHLKQVDVPIKSEAWCEKRFLINNIDSKTQVCAGEPGLSKDTCNGDSGGPLVARSQVNGRWHLVGVTSWGPNPCGEGGVYTRLSGFNDWILSTVNEIDLDDDYANF